MLSNLQETANLVRFTEILHNGKFHFLWSNVAALSSVPCL